jgi:hypothetical protein
VKGRITAYAAVQLRDYLVLRAPVVLVITAVGAWAYATFAGLTRDSFDPSASVDVRAQVERAFHVVLATFAFAGAAMAVQGLVARHRARGYDRVILSRPLDPVRYYTQGFVLAGIAAVLIGAAGAEVYGAVVHTVSLAGVAAYIAFAWLTIGGLGLLLSTVTRFHTPLLALVVAADFAFERYATGLRAAGSGSAVLDAGQYLLPPAHVVASLAGPFSQGFAFDPRVLVWPLSFGVVCVTAALFLLRERPFGT